jgi:glycosyltransferase involved in cell wall biosynthesis
VRALGALPGVAVTGAVPDIRPELARAAVVVVPLRFASGMRNKILEAWGMEKCVVSTTIGAEGLEYRDGADILVADGAAALAERVVAALGDPALRAAVGRAGREIVTGRHRPDALARSYHGAIAAVVAEGRRADRPLRAVVDLRWMRPGVAGGIESLSRAFVRHLVRLDGYNRYTVLVPSEARFEFDARRSANVRIEVTDGPAALARRVLWRGASALHRRLGLDYWRSPEVETLRAAARRGADVVFSPAGWIQPDVAPSRNLLVVVDLQHEIRPEFFTPAVAAERRRVVGGSIRQADHLIAISEHTRRSVIERLGIDPRRITTLHLAADPVFHPDRRVPGRTRAVLARHGLAAGTYLLFPANTWPHKNHAGALRALALLRDAHRLTPSLVLTGAPKEAEPEVHRLAGALGLDGQVRFLGYCPVDDMPALYEGAAALFFPSFFEGFGLPLVEAMWSGCPIVASRATSLPEVAGDAALLVNPDAPEEMAAALARVLESDDLRRDLVARGRARAPRFSWATFTRETIRLLREVATGELSR